MSTVPFFLNTRGRAMSRRLSVFFFLTYPSTPTGDIGTRAHDTTPAAIEIDLREAQTAERLGSTCWKRLHRARSIGSELRRFIPD